MKAAYYNEYGELDNIKTGDLDKPEPGEGEVLVRIKAAGVNPEPLAWNELVTPHLNDDNPS